jgi:hypothetical protein
VLGFTPGGLGVAAGLDGIGVGDGADECVAGNGDDLNVGVSDDADFEGGDSKDDVNERVPL